MQIVTWNVNSLKARLERVEMWLAENTPDVLCMQETKLGDADFPALAFEALGYAVAHHGQGQWNGVAIASRVGLDDVVANFADGQPPDEEARVVAATCGGVRVHSIYVPNGRVVGHEQYDYKLRWLERLRGHLDAACDPAADVVVCGDWNIAPSDLDVWDPAEFEGATHVSEPERSALERIKAWGLVDTFRQRHGEAKIFSWWDYRAGNFHQGKGMRIDYVLSTPSLASRSTDDRVDRNARKGKPTPSDHAPVIAVFED